MDGPTASTNAQKYEQERRERIKDDLGRLVIVVNIYKRMARGEYPGEGERRSVNSLIRALVAEWV